jgi:thiol-disulfide isomerase/thioredoxin
MHVAWRQLSVLHGTSRRCVSRNQTGNFCPTLVLRYHGHMNKRALARGLIALAVIACGSPRAPGHKKVELVVAPPGDVAQLVIKELQSGARTGQQVLVYVGATWCEPCQRFHAAVEAGELDRQFPNLRLITFDLDRDGERLATAGYVSQYIPLFALPGPDGRASARKVEGSVKGDSAVAQIAPRLQALLR